MATNSPSSPIEATRNASMMAAVMAAHDRENAHNALDERERDRLAQDQLSVDEPRVESVRRRPGLLRRLLNLLPFR